MHDKSTDSLTDQIWNVYTAILVNEKDPLFMINPSIERIYNITVNRYHPEAEVLAKAAGVTMDRLDRPIINYWREHHLVNREELDEVFAGAEGYEDWTGATPSRENGWIWPRSWWHDRWKWLLGQDLHLVPRLSDDVTPEEEHSVISLATGPHWTTVELWPPSWVNTDTSASLRRGYEGVVSQMARSIGRSPTDELSPFDYSWISGQQSRSKHYRGWKGSQGTSLVAEQCCCAPRMLSIQST